MGEPQIDAAGTYDAFTRGDTWNRWPTLYFTIKQGQRVVTWSEVLLQHPDANAVDTVRWDPDREAFIIESSAFPGQPMQSRARTS